jgi:hypothetical protein
MMANFLVFVTHLIKFLITGLKSPKAKYLIYLETVPHLSVNNIDTVTRKRPCLCNGLSLFLSLHLSTLFLFSSPTIPEAF